MLCSVKEPCLYLVLMSVSVFATVLAFPPRDGITISRDEQTEPASHFSLDAARTLLQTMRKTHTSGSSYYDRSLLEDWTAIPLRPMAPNEYSQVDPQSMLPSAGGPTMTLGDFLGADPAAYEGAISDNRQSWSAGYNPNTAGISKTWSGGSDNSRPPSGETRTRSDPQPSPRISWEDLFPGDFPESKTDDLHPCDGTGPCSSNDNKSQEENERELWQPLNTTRDKWLRCNGMSCEEKAMVDDLTELLMNELTLGEYQSPQAARATTRTTRRRCNSESCRKAVSMLGCARFTVPQLQDLLTAVRLRRDLDLPNGAKDTEGTEGASARGRQKRTLLDSSLPNFNLWPANQPILYMFDGSHTAQEQQIIRSAFQNWMDRTCLTFLEVNRAVSSQYTDRVNFLLMTRDNLGGCFSYLGLVPNLKPQQVNLPPICIPQIGIPVHEIGHALGYFHTQERRDRDNYITVHWNRIEQLREQYQVQLATLISPCPYDYSSVMHYGPYDGTTSGLPIMTAKDLLYQSSMGQKVGLSFMDIKCINNAYCPNTCSGRPLEGTCAHAGYQDPKNCNQCRCADGLGGQVCTGVEPSTAGCGGTITLQQGQTQTISSPNYPNRYPTNSKCNWKIVAPSNCKVQLDFNAFDSFGIFAMERGICFHWLEVKYNSDLSRSGPRLCGNTVGNTRRFISAQNELHLMFRSEFTIPLNIFTDQPNFQYRLVGFRAQVSIVRCTGNPPIDNTCNFGNQCPNNAQCVTDTTSSVGYRCVCRAGFTGTFCETQCPNFNCNSVTPGVCNFGNQCRNNAQCVMDTTSSVGYRCVCQAGFTGAFCETQCPNFNCNSVTTTDCPAAMDLVFILDSSGSVRWFNWPKMLELAANLVDLLMIGADSTRVGVVIFGNSATVALPLLTNNNKELLKQSIRALRYGPYWTNTASGLQSARQLLQQGRSNAAKKAVLITDGPSNRNSYLTLPNAQQLRNIGTEIVAVGVGLEVDQAELQGITGSQAKIVSVASGFDALDDTATATTVLNTMCGTRADSKG